MNESEVITADGFILNKSYETTLYLPSVNKIESKSLLELATKTPYPSEFYFNTNTKKACEYYIEGTVRGIKVKDYLFKNDLISIINKVYLSLENARQKQLELRRAYYNENIKVSDILDYFKDKDPDFIVEFYNKDSEYDDYYSEVEKSFINKMFKFSVFNVSKLD